MTTTASSSAASSMQALLAEPTASAWFRRPALWGGLLLTAAALASTWFWQVRQAASTAPSYASQAVTRGKLTLTVTANGTLQPTRSVSIGSELSGTVLKVHVDVNDRVRKGQILVELDTAKLRDQILRSRAALTAASAKVAQTLATVQETESGLGRLEEVARLSAGKLPSQAEFDSSRAALARARADATSAQAGVSDAQAALSTDEINLSKASIRAPSDGVVLSRNVDPGNAVAASLQAVTLFNLAEDLAQLRLQVYVDEADVGSVQVGQSARFGVSAYPSRQFPARVTRVAYGSTITDNVVTYLTYLDVDNSDLSLRPGMTATALIIATERQDALLVPNSALRFEPTASATVKPAASGGIVSSLTPRMPPRSSTRKSAAEGARAGSARRVWVLRDGAASAVAVTAGISDGRMTEIIGGDLQAGMVVITDQKAAGTK